MTDLIERLRRYAGDVCISTPTETEAADEIERLRAEIKAAAFCDGRCSWVEHHPGCVFSERDALKAELAALKASVPDGYVLVPITPKKLGCVALSDLMDKCLPEQIEHEWDMQKLIDRLWPALCQEFAATPKPGEPT